jgi:hypothetical protein
MAARRNNKVTLGLLIIIVLACAFCGLSVLALQPASPPPPMFFGDMPVTVCAGLSNNPKWQIGVSWTLPIMSYMPPLAASPYAVCVNIPSGWVSPFLSRFKTQYMFPP